MVTALAILVFAAVPIEDGVFVRVADDGFTFETAKGERFLPMGAFYLDERHEEVDPLNWWGHFDEAHIRKDFALAASLGCNLLRVRIDPAVVDENPEAPVCGTKEDLRKCDFLVRTARENGLRLYMGLHLPGRFKQDPRYTPVWVAAYRTFAERYRDEPTIFCWELDAEATTLVGYPGDREAWDAWLAAEYGDESAVAAAWGREAAPGWRDAIWERMCAALHHHGGPDPVRGVTPSLWYLDDLNTPGDTVLHDWQRFREHLYTQKVRPLADAVRKAAPNHLVTLDLILWAFPFAKNPGPAGWGGPYGYAGLDLEAMGKMVDFVGVHTYPQYIPPRTTEWYESLFRDERIFERQLRYLETLCRYVRAATEAPVLHTETGWHGGDGDWQGNTEADQLRWNTALIDNTRDCALGWVNWTLRDVPTHEGVTQTGGLAGPAIRTRPDVEDINPLSKVLCAGDLPDEAAGLPKAWGKAFAGVVADMHATDDLRFVPGTAVSFPRRAVLTAKLDTLHQLLMACIDDAVFPCDIVLEDYDPAAPTTAAQRLGARMLAEAGTGKAPAEDAAAAGVERLIGVTPD